MCGGGGQVAVAVAVAVAVKWRWGLSGGGGGGVAVAVKRVVYRGHWISVSSRPRVANYTIGRDRGGEECA